MKKNLIRGIALALVLILALGIIPLAALAADFSVDVGAYGANQDSLNLKDDPNKVLDGTWYEESVSSKGKPSVTIKASDYDKYVLKYGNMYDLQGLVDFDETYKGKDGNFVITNSLTFKEYGMAWLLYTPHNHKLSRWYSDGTTHWRECLVCKQLNPSHETMFMYQNWCQDGDEDQVCNVCGGHVPYHDITIIESEGGKITVNRDNASHRMKITADVETTDGYQFVKLHFTKVRPDGSKQEVVRYGQGKSFWTNMPTYPMEVTAEFIKK